MVGKQYRVKDGDSLWYLADRFLGDPQRWPEIYHYNNKQSVSSKTGQKINDPDLIFVGQTLYLPPSDHRAKTKSKDKRQNPNARPVPSATGKRKAQKRVRGFPFEYRLEDLPPITVVSPTHIATVRLKGAVTLQSKHSIEYASLSQKGVYMSAKRKADYALGQLVTDSQLGFEPRTGEVTFECGITAHANHPRALSTTASAGVSSTTGLPVVKGTITTSPIKGRVFSHFYATSKLSFEIEITPKSPDSGTPNAKKNPVPNARRDPAPRSSGRDAWDYLAGGALIVGAGVLVTATLVEDVLTLGWGVADNPVSFAAAAGMFSGGVALFRPVRGGKPIPIEGHKVDPKDL